MKVPVLVHRWFANGGAGWSCHPDLKAHILECQAALTGHLNGELGPVEPIEVMGAACVLVGVRMPDPDRETDERNRRVNVFCAAVLPGRPLDEATEGIRDLLKTIALPTQQGMNPQLQVDWSGSLTALAPEQSVVKLPISPVKTQAQARAFWIGAAASVFLVVLVVLFFLGKFTPPSPDATKNELPPAEKMPRKPDADVKSKPDTNAVVSEMISEINVPGEMERLVIFLKDNEQVIVTLEDTDKVRIREAFINRCRYLKAKRKVQFSDLYFQRAKLVDDDVSEARHRIEVIKKAADVFGNGKELEKLEKEEWDFIEGALYGRVQWCWKALEKEFHKEDDKKKTWAQVTSQFKAKEWHKARTAFGESYDGYSADRKFDDAKRETVNKMNTWLIYLQQPHDYVFEIAIPEKGECDIKKTREWNSSDWELNKKAGKFVLTGKKIVATSKLTPIMLFPVELAFRNDRQVFDRALLYWRIGDDQTEISGFKGPSAKESVIVVLTSSKAAVWPIITSDAPR